MLHFFPNGPYNHAHHTSFETQDTGAIYSVTNMGGWDPHMKVETNKLSRGNIIRYNLVHDTGGYGRVGPGKYQYPFYSLGIYLDLATSGTHVYGNVVFNAYTAALQIGGGQDNVCENNIFADSGSAVFYYDWVDRFPMMRNRIERNIFYSNSKGSLYTIQRVDNGPWRKRPGSFDNNLIYFNGKMPSFGIKDANPNDQWKWWLNEQMDTHSIMVDPLFVDAKNHDYRLRPESPAIKLGFKPIDLRKIGLYSSPDRASWPVDDNQIYREKFVSDIHSQ